MKLATLTSWFVLAVGLAGIGLGTYFMVFSFNLGLLRQVGATMLDLTHFAAALYAIYGAALLTSGAVGAGFALVLLRA
jgi:hypothetical protein